MVLVVAVHPGCSPFVLVPLPGNRHVIVSGVPMHALFSDTLSPFGPPVPLLFKKLLSKVGVPCEKVVVNEGVRIILEF